MRLIRRPSGYAGGMAAPSSVPARHSERRPVSRKAHVALALGIVALLGTLLYPLAGVVFGVAAAIVGDQERKALRDDHKVGRSQAQAGFFFGLIALIGSLLFIFAIFTWGPTVGS